MGMEQRVTFGTAARPLWPAVGELLSVRGFPVQMRMIDGELAFPDEAPPDNWRELRLGVPAGMVTLRRDEASATLVVWGNADPGLRQAWNALTWACAEVTGGRIDTPEGAVSAKDFQARAELPEGLRG
ncbi:MAG: hypothetical protein IT429_00160 [Gemmataceae bacterium]|nr:hypothetical protein [Gemmataceae bacterium]